MVLFIRSGEIIFALFHDYWTDVEENSTGENTKI